MLEVSGVSGKMSSPYGACFIYLVEGYVCGKLVMNVFGLAVASLFVSAIWLCATFSICRNKASV